MTKLLLSLSRKRLAALFALVVVLGLPGSARATVWSYTPNPADMNDLDHYYLYAWRITDGTLANNINSATIQFTQLYNWDSNPNKLFMWLFDTSNAAGAVSNGGTV